MREAVYQRARAALARQLTAVDPPLTSREIETQHQELEDAVARLEAEFAPPEPIAHRYEPDKDEFSFTPEPQPEPVPMPVAPPSRRQPPPPVHAGLDEGVADFDADDDEDEDYDDDDERGSRLPALIGLLVVILVIAGIGAYAYSQRDAVFGLLGFGSGSQQAETASPASTPPQAAGDDESNKQPDRLTNGTEPPPAPATLPETAMSGPVETGEMAPAPDMTTAPDTMGQSDQQMASADSGSGTDLVAQRAIYYYQGAEGEQGEAYNGTATWANIEKDGRPAIHATLSIPDRNVQASISIYKNYDNTLPASHLVEIEFKGNLSGNPIERVPALVLKQTEQARGQPLAGAAVPVTNNLFWIALSDDPDQVSRNLQLLREGSWFDIPILFNDQTRALLTFEKGIPGDKVFQAVMASWTP